MVKSRNNLLAKTSAKGGGKELGFQVANRSRGTSLSSRGVSGGTTAGDSGLPRLKSNQGGQGSYGRGL